MLKVASKKRLVKLGNSVGFLIDKAYLKNEQISTEKTYDVYIEEVEK